MQKILLLIFFLLTSNICLADERDAANIKAIENTANGKTVILNALIYIGDCTTPLLDKDIDAYILHDHFVGDDEDGKCIHIGTNKSRNHEPTKSISPTP